MTFYLDSYKSIFLDISLSDFWTVSSLIRNEQTLPSLAILSNNLIEFWSEKNHQSNHYYLPLLCVRTGFDLFLRANQFPPNSEIIMSAVNIPSMITLVQYHQLKVIPCDIDRQTLKMNINDLRRLITSNTVAILYAHIYGRCIDVTEYVHLAEEKQIYFIEDCAESFAGFCSCTTKNKESEQSSVEMYCPRRRNDSIESTCCMGHPRSHLVLYSFGVLKFCTALGGGFAKLSDSTLFKKMSEIYSNDPIQKTELYRTNVKKYFYLYWLLNVPNVIKPLMYIVRLLNLNHMEYVVNRLRAFNKNPTSEELFLSLRRRPCRPLLAFLLHRFQNYRSEQIKHQREKALFVSNQLAQNPLFQFVGLKCPIRNFWLFPIIVPQPDQFVKILSKHHIDAYRGTTQLNVITNLLTDTENLPETIHTDRRHQCPNAEYLIENVIYLPVHCHVPMSLLQQLIDIVNRTGDEISKITFRSKL